MSIRYPDMAALVLRLAFGSMMAFGHGYGKLLRLFSAEEIHFVTYFGLSAKTNLALTAFALPAQAHQDPEIAGFIQVDFGGSGFLLGDLNLFNFPSI